MPQIHEIVSRLLDGHPESRVLDIREEAAARSDGS